MNFKILVLILHLLGSAYNLALHIVSYRSAGNPTPANVADVYDAETYSRWKAYSAEKCRLRIVSTILSFLLLFALLPGSWGLAGLRFSLFPLRRIQTEGPRLGCPHRPR